MNAKTTHERQQEFRERMAKQGFKEIRSLFAHPDDIKRIRDYVERLNKKRLRDQ